MHTKNIRVFPASLLGAMLWLVPVSPLVFSACDAEPVKVSVTMEADYSQIIEAIQGTSQTLTAKMALIESALSQGFADDNAAQELLRQAVSSLTGTAEDKLGAVETAVRNGTSSLETKLGLIEAAVAGGFADGNAQLALIQTAIASLSGSLAEKLAAVETAVKSQTTSLSTKLGVIETALTEGLADEKKAQALLHQAVEALEGTAAERLLAIEQAVGNQASSLATKLGLIDAAIRDGFLDQKAAQGLIREAVATLGNKAADSLWAIDTAVSSQTLALWTKLELIEAALASGLTDEATALGGIERALRSMQQGNVSGIVTKIQAIKTTLEGKVARGLSDIFTAIDTLADYREILVAINQAVYNMTDHSINGHEFIEMGPGRKWATMNVGATLPEEKGDYYAWGDVEPYYTSLDPLVWKTGKSGGYIGENYKWVEHGGTHDDRSPEDRITKYTLERDRRITWWYSWDEYIFRGDNAKELGDPKYDYADDVARQDWGATWRIPTKADWEWLIENCTWESTTDYKGKKGLLITSYIPGYEFNQIFLPAAGKIASVYGSGCEYWSSTLKETSEAYRLTMVVSNWTLVWLSRWWGLPVRPVSD